MRYVHPQNVRYPPRVKSPTSDGVVLKYRFAKSGELNARNTVNERNCPAVRPTVWAVEAYERFSTESKVRAQPAGCLS